MHFNTLLELRQQMYGCFERSQDALFNLSDALLSESAARSLPELSLSLFFQRRWPRVYEALQDGRINGERLRTVFVQTLLRDKAPTEPIWVGLDSSSLPRPEAETSADRGMIYVPNLPHASKPGSVGYQFSTLMLLPDQPGSWVGILDQRRLSSEQTVIEVGVEQLRAVLPQIQQPVILLADRWYATARVVQACHELAAAALIRLKRNRKLYRAAPARKEKQRGAPCKHGPLFQGSRPQRYGPADAEWEGVDEQGKRVQISCWKGLHFREAPALSVSVIRVLREAARDSKRDPRESWFLWTGKEDLALSQVRSCYRKRFSQEHGYRFLKQDLLWTAAHLRTPEHLERWSWMVACACNQLLRCQHLGQAVLRPWKTKCGPSPRDRCAG